MIDDELEFEWDAAKARQNFRKHQVTFEAAAAAFRDPTPVVFFEAASSFEEERWILIGSHGGKKPLFVVFTHRMHGEKHVIRLISARRADHVERRFYENERFQEYRR